MKRIKQVNLPCFAAACLAAALFIYFGYQSVDAGMTDSYQAVIIGDSIPGKARGSEDIRFRFEEVSGMTMYNGAFGGNCASASEDAYRYSFQEESLSLYKMAEAISRKDFGVQLADLSASQVKVWYFDEVMQGLSRIDFEKVDILLIEYGVNDYAYGRKLDNEDAPCDVRTYGGALRYSIELLRKAYPELKIVMVTPIPCKLPATGSGTLEKYVDKEKEIAAEYGLEVIDAYHESGFDESNLSLYLEDDLHLNHDGRQIYGTFLAEEVKKLAKQTAA